MFCLLSQTCGPTGVSVSVPRPDCRDDTADVLAVVLTIAHCKVFRCEFGPWIAKCLWSQKRCNLKILSMMHISISSSSTVLSGGVIVHNIVLVIAKQISGAVTYVTSDSQMPMGSLRAHLISLMVAK